MISRDVFCLCLCNTDRNNGHMATTLLCGKRLHLVYNSWTADKFMDGDTLSPPHETKSCHTIYRLSNQDSMGSNILKNLWDFPKRRFDFNVMNVLFSDELSRQRRFLCLELEFDSSWSKEILEEPCKV